jgi:hypothetical protein
LVVCRPAVFGTGKAIAADRLAGRGLSDVDSKAIYRRQVGGFVVNGYSGQEVRKEVAKVNRAHMGWLSALKQKESAAESRDPAAPIKP